MTVELLHWPREKERRAQLHEASQPRLLLVDPAASPPLTVDPAEDWVRLPAHHRDVQARVESLRRRSAAEPTLDEGVLRTASGWVSLPDLEARIVEVLLSKFGKVADRQSLLAAGWPGETPSRNLLDVHLHRLRRRIDPVGLQIRTVRKRGYVLEAMTPSPAALQP
ncbi:MAG: helix-turn-helix domain-containing protein [Actinomycetota bacterium]